MSVLLRPRAVAFLFLTALLSMSWCPGPLRAQVEEGDRKIAPNDLLFITIVDEKDLQTDFRVSSSGTLQFPFIENVDATGLTPAELAARIKEQLIAKEYFVDPQVLVLVKDYRKQYVRVNGQVTKPGLVELPGEQKFDIIDAIAFAGGTTRLANENKIEFTRNGKTTTYSLRKLKEEADPNRRMWVESGDIIDVKEVLF